MTINKTRIYKALILIFLVMNIGFAQTGSISGKVIHAETQERLIGANIFLEDTNIGTASDINGEFIIKNVPSGAYNISVSFIGFQKKTLTDVIVKPGRNVRLEIALNETNIETEEVTIHAGYFHEDSESPISTTEFSYEEIRRAPGAGGDVSRILQMMPSVAQISENTNDLVVRGGSPAENLFLIDGIPIRSINHFAHSGTSGGAVGILNVDLIDDVRFLTSGFPVKYGDRLSSVVQLDLRKGDPDQFNFQFDFNMGGIGGVAEGPLGNNASFLLSAKHSYLELIDKIIDSGAASTYDDAQLKVSLDLPKNHSLTILDIFGRSEYEYDREHAIENNFNAYGKGTYLQNTFGISYKALWSKKTYSETALSYSFFRQTRSNIETITLKEIEGNEIFENSVHFRDHHYINIAKDNQLELGFEAQYEFHEYSLFQKDLEDRFGNPSPDFDVSKNIESFRASGYVNYSLTLFDRLTTNLGGRTDYYSLNEKQYFSPRFSVHYKITDRFSLNGAVGVFYQQLPLVLLSQNARFEKLPAMKSNHYAIGFDYLITPDTKLSLEVYDKEYENLPLNPEDPSLSILDYSLSYNWSGLGMYENLGSNGKAYTRGVELMIRKKLAKDFYGIISGTYFRSKYQGYNNTWYNREYDNQYIVSIVGGYRPNNEWEFSTRFTLAGGRPYTPFDIAASTEAQTGILQSNNINGDRYDAYHSLKIRVDRRFFFETSSLVLYLSINNIYNKKNIAYYYWNEVKNKIGEELQFGLLPIIGVEYEF